MKNGKRIGIIILALVCFAGLCMFAYQTIQEEKELYKLRSFYTETLTSKINAEEENEVNKRKINVLNQKVKEQEKTIKEKDATIADKDAQIKKLNQEIANLKKAKAAVAQTTKSTAAITGGESYRLTYFTDACVGAGFCGKRDFQVNDKGWYTYKGKVVVATATTYLLKQGWSHVDGIVYHKYYDTLKFTLNGVTYDAIVLDSCGACMKRDIIDLYVKDDAHGITTQVTVKQ